MSLMGMVAQVKDTEAIDDNGDPILDPDGNTMLGSVALFEAAFDGMWNILAAPLNVFRRTSDASRLAAPLNIFRRTSDASLVFKPGEISGWSSNMLILPTQTGTTGETPKPSPLTVARGPLPPNRNTRRHGR